MDSATAGFLFQLKACFADADRAGMGRTMFVFIGALPYFATA
jgi:hypothetical protein